MIQQQKENKKSKLAMCRLHRKTNVKIIIKRNCYDIDQEDDDDDDEISVYLYTSKASKI